MILPLTLSIIPLTYSAIIVCAIATFTAVQEGHFIRTGRGGRLVFIAEYEAIAKGQCTLVLHPTEGSWGDIMIISVDKVCSNVASFC